MKTPSLLPTRLLPLWKSRVSLPSIRYATHPSLKLRINVHVVAGADEVVLRDWILSFPCGWGPTPAMLSKS